MSVLDTFNADRKKTLGITSQNSGGSGSSSDVSGQNMYTLFQQDRATALKRPDQARPVTPVEAPQVQVAQPNFLQRAEQTIQSIPGQIGKLINPPKISNPVLLNTPIDISKQTGLDLNSQTKTTSTQVTNKGAPNPTIDAILKSVKDDLKKTNLTDILIQSLPGSSPELVKVLHKVGSDPEIKRQLNDLVTNGIVQPAYAPAGMETATQNLKEPQINSLVRDWEANKTNGSLGEKLNLGLGNLIVSIPKGLTGGIIKADATPTTDVGKVASIIGETMGQAVTLRKIGATIDSLASGSETIGKFIENYPKIAKVIVPWAKNVIGFDIYGQLDPTQQNRLQKFAIDTAAGTIFHAFGSIKNGLISVPLNFATVYGLGKFGGMSDHDAFVLAGTVAILDGAQRGKDYLFDTRLQTKQGVGEFTPQQIRDQINGTDRATTDEGKTLLAAAQAAEIQGKNVEINAYGYKESSRIQDVFQAKTPEGRGFSARLVEPSAQIGDPNASISQNPTTGENATATKGLETSQAGQVDQSVQAPGSAVGGVQEAAGRQLATDGFYSRKITTPNGDVQIARPTPEPIPVEKAMVHSGNSTFPEVQKRGVLPSQNGIFGPGVYFADPSSSSLQEFGSGESGKMYEVDKSKFDLLTLNNQKEEGAFLSSQGFEPTDKNSLVAALQKSGKYDGAIITNPSSEIGSTYVISNLEKLDSIVKGTDTIAQPKTASSNQDLQTYYKNADQPKVQQAWYEVMAELDNSQAGTRIFDENGSFTGSQESTFPDWVDPDLRSSKLFKSVFDSFKSPDTLKYPPNSQPQKQRLYDLILGEIDGRAGTDSSDIIQQLKENNANVTGKEKTAPEAGKPSSTRSEGPGKPSPTTQEVGSVPPNPKTDQIPHKDGFSRFQERLEQQLLDANGNKYNFDATKRTYDKVNLKEDAQAALDFMAKDPKRALNIALGRELPKPGEPLQFSIANAVMLKAFDEGDIELGTQIANHTTQTATRYGQNNASLRGNFNDNSPQHFIKNLIDDRMESFGKKLIGSVKAAAAKEKSASPRTRAVEQIDREVDKLKEVVRKSRTKQQDIELAQKIIEQLKCS